MRILALVIASSGTTDTRPPTPRRQARLSSRRKRPGARPNPRRSRRTPPGGRSRARPSVPGLSASGAASGPNDRTSPVRATFRLHRSTYYTAGRHRSIARSCGCSGRRSPPSAESKPDPLIVEPRIVAFSLGPPGLGRDRSCDAPARPSGDASCRQRRVWGDRALPALFAAQRRLRPRAIAADSGALRSILGRCHA
jgi:hypothetical protein